MHRRFRGAVAIVGALAVSAPAFAQNDFSGEWAPVRNQDNTENPMVGDWVGIPLNEAGLARSEVTAFHVQWQQAAETPIYLDGRAAPPDYAPFTWMGFSTAKWEGDVLKITTTNIKEDYLRRNGIFVSDKARRICPAGIRSRTSRRRRCTFRRARSAPARVDVSRVQDDAGGQ